MNGILYLCPTPVGNLGDITLRALDILKKVDVIAAEDTRQTRKLLSHFDIHTPLISLHEHNERGQGARLVDELLAGRSVALVSDAGSPGISDPGEVLVGMAVAAGISVVPLPGPTAFVPALTASGLPTGRFLFVGFLSRGRKERAEELADLRHVPATLIFYEAPHRLRETLQDLLESFGNRRAVAAREISKRFEEFVRGDLVSLLDHYRVHEPKGEFVLLVDKGEKTQTPPALSADDVSAAVQALIEKGFTPKDAMKEAARQAGLSKREVYRLLLKGENRQEPTC